MRAVGLAGVSLLCSAGVDAEGATGGKPGEIEGFRARDHVVDRKSLKLMTRSVKLGVSAVGLALAQWEGWQEVPPPRRGIFVGATPMGGDEDLFRAVEASSTPEGKLDMRTFATEGLPKIHPLWLVKGLSNNVLGLSSSHHDLQGVNANYCQGESSGARAVLEGVLAVAEDRADLVLAGASDSWIRAQTLLGTRNAGEGAAFFLFRPAAPDDPWVVQLEDTASVGPWAPEREEASLGFLGAAGDVVAMARALWRGEATGLDMSGGRRVSISPARAGFSS